MMRIAKDWGLSLRGVYFDKWWTIHRCRFCHRSGCHGWPEGSTGRSSKRSIEELSTEHPQGSIGRPLTGPLPMKDIKKKIKKTIVALIKSFMESLYKSHRVKA